MGRNGSQAAYSSERGLGTTDQNISTDTSIIISIIARAIADRCPRAANMSLNTVQNFMAKQCMMHMAMKPRVGTSKN